jgi:hypothetical protein
MYAISFTMIACREILQYYEYEEKQSSFLLCRKRIGRVWLICRKIGYADNAKNIIECGV